ncbi:MAG TPA: thiamine pyrophosphate-binding protein [Acidimicrobiia bacterium]|nr:thiamine pyrophosphate-binding protein [Acidimicrobiia bacterium]
MNGAQAVATALRAAHVDTVFGLPGAHNLALWPACADADIRIVGIRHEQGCAHAADGYARATGRLGVALVTTGPGAANTVGAVGEAWASRSPLVVIASDIPTTLRRPGMYRGVLHECTDQAALFAPVTKARTSSVVEALYLASTPPTRPTYVGVPMDVLASAVPAEPSPAPWRAARANVAPLLEALTRSQRPLLWVGGGARDAGAELDALARRLGAPVITTYQARGVLPASHPLLVPAPPHEPEVSALVASSDLVIVVGSDLDQMNTMQWRLPLPPRRIALNIDPLDATKNYAIDAVIAGDARLMGPIAEELSPRDPWAGSVTGLGIAIRARLGADPQTGDAMAFLEATETALGANAIVFADMCVAGYWLAGHLRVERARGLQYPMGWGTLGFAPAAAIGAAAGTGTPTVCFVGDGGMLFALGELSALAQHHAPCTIVVVDDQGYGMLRFGAHATPANELPPADFVGIARSFGIDATVVDGFGEDYLKALAAAVSSGEPRLLHVRARLHPPSTTTPFWPMQG